MLMLSLERHVFLASHFTPLDHQQCSFGKRVHDDLNLAACLLDNHAGDHLP